MGYPEGDTVETTNFKNEPFRIRLLNGAPSMGSVRLESIRKGSMLVMEVVKPGAHESIHEQGVFQAEVLGIEAAAKVAKALDTVEPAH
jgi:hypothetical protein